MSGGRGVTLVLRTEASKLTRSRFGRPMAATHVAQTSCPAGCAFRAGGGCYAELGPEGYVTRRLAGQAGSARLSPLQLALEEARLIYAAIARDRAACVGVPLRLHVVGDCADGLSASIVARAAERWMDCGGGPAYSYTHGWREVDRRAWGRVSVLASCETLQDVVSARARGYGVALVGDWDAGAVRGSEGVSGAFVCPQQTGGRPDCASCGACWRIGGAEAGAALAGCVLVLRPHGPGRGAGVGRAVRRRLAVLNP